MSAHFIGMREVMLMSMLVCVCSCVRKDIIVDETQSHLRFPFGCCHGFYAKKL